MIKYYRVPAASVESYRTKSEEALGHTNLVPRYSLDNSEALMKFDDQNLPVGFTGEGYDKEQILLISNSDIYQVGGDPYIEEEI